MMAMGKQISARLRKATLSLTPVPRRTRALGRRNGKGIKAGEQHQNKGNAYPRHTQPLPQQFMRDPKTLLTMNMNINNNICTNKKKSGGIQWLLISDAIFPVFQGLV